MKKLFSVYCLVLFSFSGFSQLQYDWENWTTIGVKKDFKKNFSWDANYQIRFDHDLSAFKSSYISTGIGYKVNKYVSFDLSYRYATNAYRDMHRFSGALLLSYKVKKIEFTLRNMVQNEREYFNARYEKGHEPLTSLRERLQISYSIIKPIKLYVNSEVFFSLQNTGISTARFRCVGGVDFKIKKNHTLSPAYLIQANFPVKQIVQGVLFEYTYELPSWKKVKKVLSNKKNKK